MVSLGTGHARGRETMKITIGVPSRGRSLELAAAVLALWKMRSQGHEVSFVIAYDEDDVATLDAVAGLRMLNVPTLSSPGPRPLGLGELHNRMVAATDPEAAFVLWIGRRHHAVVQFSQPKRARPG